MASNRRTGRQDIKKQTKSRFVSFDTDIGSHGFEENEPSKIARGPTVSRQLQAIQRDISGQKALVSNQHMRAASGRRDKAYEVTMKHEGKFNVNIVMETLNQLEEKIIPINFVEVAKKKSVKLVKFFVCTQEEAENLKLMSRRLVHPANIHDKFVITFAQHPSPWDMLDIKLKLAIKEVVKSRHNSSTNSIDLSNFQASKILLDLELRTPCLLTRTSIMVEVIRVISDLFPDIMGLSLKNNRLPNLSYVQSFTYACKKIVELDLSDNLLENADELKGIRLWEVQRMSLANNPLCSAYPDFDSYTSAVQDYFPHVSYLDGVTVQPNMNKIIGDLRRRCGILFPPVQIGYFPEKTLKSRVEELLVQFYEIYDRKPSETSRQLLASAYDENATFTYSICELDERDFKKFQYCDGEKFQRYLYSSHNLCNDQHWENFTDPIVFKGPMEIVAMLSKLPSTEHDQSSFLLEFLTVRQQILVFTLHGIFCEEPDAKKPVSTRSPASPFKFFTRTFTVVPRPGDKLAIVNDTLMLAPMNKQWVESCKDKLKKISDSSVESLNGAGDDQAAMEELQRRQAQQAQLQTGQHKVTYDRNDPAVQQAMVEAFSQQSGMKPEWAKKCLEDTQWDFETAGRVFNEVRGQIPADAFL